MTGITIHSTQEHVTARPYRDDQDFWRVRNLLIETYPITPPDFNWEVRRWDGSRFHSKEAVWEPYWDGRVGLWETAGLACGRPWAAGWWAPCIPTEREWLVWRFTPTTGTSKRR